MIRKCCMALALAAVLMGAAGCVSFHKSAPEKHYYVLDVERTGPARPAVENAVLKVGEVRISPLYDKTELIYRIGDLE